MNKSVVVIMGGLSGERKISFLTGKACSKAVKKRGYRVRELDAKGYFVEKLKRLKLSFKRAEKLFPEFIGTYELSPDFSEYQSVESSE